jgi:tetratricopeptide (TPR) repeat protein
MSNTCRLFAKTAVVSVVLAGLVGCGGSEKAIVPISYTLAPSKGLPPGLTTVAILPAERGPATDDKWSDMTASVVRAIIQKSNEQFGTNLRVADYDETKKIFAQSDMAAAGMIDSPGNLGESAKMLNAQAFILSKINVKVDTQKGKKRTVSGLSGAGWGGYGWGGGGGSVDTAEVETVRRHMTVQTEFKITDASTAKVWDSWSDTYESTEKTKASPFFGSSQTEAELDSTDMIIGTLVERGAREFLSKLIPCPVEYEVEVKSSGNEACQRGVQYLRGDLYEEALEQFKIAIAENPEDDKACFGAGVACEKLGRYDEAYTYYQRACVAKRDQEYVAAKDRMAANKDRIQQQS